MRPVRLPFKFEDGEGVGSLVVAGTTLRHDEREVNAALSGRRDVVPVSCIFLDIRPRARLQVTRLTFSRIVSTLAETFFKDSPCLLNSLGALHPDQQDGWSTATRVRNVSLPI